MNIYTAEFFANCPNNGARVKYELRIQTGEVIPVEQINAKLNGISDGYHEEIADELQQSLGGTQTLRAHHHGVHIETIRPHLAHWSK